MHATLEQKGTQFRRCNDIGKIDEVYEMCTDGTASESMQTLIDKSITRAHSKNAGLRRIYYGAELFDSKWTSQI